MAQSQVDRRPCIMCAFVAVVLSMVAIILVGTTGPIVRDMICTAHMNRDEVRVYHNLPYVPLNKCKSEK